VPDNPYVEFRQRPNRRQFLKTSAAALSGFALSSCGWRLAQVRPNQSRDSNKLYIYTWAGYTDQDLLDEFTARTGVEAVVNVFSDNESMLAKIQASGGGGYSIIYPSDYMVEKMINLDLLQKLDHSRLPDLDNLFSRFQDPSYDPGNRHSVPISWGTSGFVYNRDRLQEELQSIPKDWDYVWTHKDKLERQFTLVNDVREVMGATLRMLGYSYNETDPEAIKQAYEKLLELKPAIASFDSDSWRPRVLRGSLDMAMCYSSDANEVMKEDSNLDYVLPASGSSLWTDTLVIPKFAPNTEAAYQWIDFMLQPEITAEIVKRLSFATPNKEAYKMLPPEIQQNNALFPPESALERTETIRPLPPKTLELYDKYWTRLTSV
jgi:spermidine/putrescine transport system substrate-binding protein